MKDFNKTLLVIMIGTVGLSSCADSWEEMRKEKYEKEWVKTFGEVDPNHTWNLATQVTADLAIKEDALTEYTFKVYTSDPIWGTDAKLLAKATVKTDEIGYAETQIKFDAPSSQERYYITRTDSHGRRLLKVSDIENKKIGVKFGITNAGSRGLHEEESFDSLKIENPYTEDIIRGYLENAKGINERDGSQWNVGLIGDIVKTTANGDLPIGDGFAYKGDENNPDKYIFIINHNVTIASSNNSNDKMDITGLNIIINKGASLTINRELYLNKNARIYIMEGGTLNAYAGTHPGDGEQATMKTPSINIWNDNSLLYNAGIINMDYMLIQSGTFYNAESGVLPGTGDSSENNPQSHISFSVNQSGILTNFGKIKVNRIYGNANHSTFASAATATQNGTINNGCYIDVKERFCIRDLNLATNSAIESESMAINSVTLRASSILRTDKFGAQNATWQFVGDSTIGRALISSKEVDYIHSGGVTINGPIYFEANNYSEAGINNGDGGYNNYQRAIENAYSKNNTTGAGFGKVGSAPFLIIPDGFYDEEHDDISKADCVGHGNIPKEFEDIVDKSIEWVVAFEDLGSTGDYDFNDAVLGISHDKEKNLINVTPLAAGGTIHAEIFYNDKNLGEIHNLLGSDATNAPINVNNRGSEGTKTEIPVEENFTITKDWTKFSIKVNGKSGTVYEINPNKEAGDAPQAICMPAPWFWAKEGINIHDAYIQFGGWVTDQETNQKWHQNPTREKIAL